LSERRGVCAIGNSAKQGVPTESVIVSLVDKQAVKLLWQVRSVVKISARNQPLHVCGCHLYVLCNKTRLVATLRNVKQNRTIWHNM
jgi:hypothetical protein